jgi:hypothetical protein
MASMLGIGYDNAIDTLKNKLLGREKSLPGFVTLGHYQEEVGAKLYAEYTPNVRLKTTTQINVLEYQHHGLEGRLGGTIDRWKYNTLLAKPKREIVEFKSTRYFSGKNWNDTIPLHYYVQGQVCMVVTKCKQMELARIWGGLESFDVYDIQHDSSLTNLFKAIGCMYLACKKLYEAGVHIDQVVEHWDALYAHYIPLGAKQMIADSHIENVQRSWSLDGTKPLDSWLVYHKAAQRILDF